MDNRKPVTMIGQASKGFTLLFDLDGTLTDTDHLHLGAYATLLGEQGRTLTVEDYRARVMGAPNPAIMEYLFPHHPPHEQAALVERKEALVRAAMGLLQPTRGLLDLLDWADRHGMAYGVVTNAPRANAEAMLAGLGLETRFPVLVIGDELAHGKPHPLPYLTGLERLGGTASRAVAFEDSLSGIRAAAAAGLYTFGIRTALADSALRGAGTDAVIDDFTDPVLWSYLEAHIA